MDEDRFDRKMIDIESRSYEVSMLIAGFVFEILETFDEMQSDICCEIPYCDPVSGYKTVTAEFIKLDAENGIVSINVSGRKDSVMWDDLDMAAKEILMTELHHKRKSLNLYKNYNAKEEIH